MKVFVTGSSGYIGTHYQELSKHSLHLYDRIAVPSARHSAVPFVGISDPRLGHDLKAEGIEVILHMAGAGVNPNERDLGELARTNALMAMQVVELGAEIGAKCIVILGSSSEYAALEEPRRLVEEDRTESLKAYGTTKACGSALARMAGAQLGIKVIIARLFNVYGMDERPHRLLPSLIEGLENSRRTALSPGTQMRDFVYISDVCSALDELLERGYAVGFPEGIYNVCTGIGTSVRAFAETVADRMGRSPTLLGFGDIAMRPDDLPFVVGDDRRISERTAWRPKFTVEAGIMDTLRRRARASGR